VVGPEPALVPLGGVRGVGDRREGGVGLGARVAGGEGDVVSWVPVFGGDLEGEGIGEEGVDGGDDVAALGDCQGAVLVGC